MKIGIFILSLFLFPALVFANNAFPKAQSLLNKTHAERTLALSDFYEQTLVNADSVEIFNYIQKVANIAEKGNDTDLALEAEFMRVHYFVYPNYFSESRVVSKIEKLDKKAKKQGVIWLEVRTQSLLGNYLYFRSKNYGRGYEHLLRCVQLLEGKKPEEYPLKQICLYHVGIANYHFREYDDARKYFALALEASSEYDRYYYKMHILNTLGMCYLKKGKLTIADQYFRQTLENALTEKDSVWEAITYQNIASVLTQTGGYNEAVSLLEKAMDLSNNQGEAIINDLLLLVEIYIRTGQLGQAKETMTKLVETYKETGSTLGKLQYYTLQSKLLSFSSSGELTVAYLDSAFQLKDSLDKVFNSKLIIKAQQRLDYENQKSLQKQKEVEQSRKLWIRNGLIVLLILLLVIIILVYNRHRLKAKIREQKMLADQEKAEASLERFRKTIRDKNAMIDQFEGELKSATKEVQNLKEKTKQTNSPEQHKEVIHRLQETAILTEKDWREFVELFEKAHSGFFARLQTKYPNLTKAEIRMMALCRLRLDNKEMSLMLGVGAAAIRKNKSRLRKKIDPERNVDLEVIASMI